MASTEFQELVAPISSALSEYVLAKTGIWPSRVQYSYSTEPVRPEKSQRGRNRGPDNWHTDGVIMNPGHEALLVSSALTTDIIVRNGNSAWQRFRQERLRRRLTGNTVSQSHINNALDAEIVSIYNAEPYEMVVTTKSVHRSRLNTTAELIPRVFLRAQTSSREKEATRLF
jgi:hypothetical protein